MMAGALVLHFLALVAGCSPGSGGSAAEAPASASPAASAPAASTPAPAAPPAAPTPPPAPEPLPARVVALGDLHGDLDNAIRTLQLAGATDAEGRWTGGDLTLVQTGDTIDRGPDSKAVIELLQRLQREAQAAGGRVIAVVGNHEAMNVLGDWRYVAEGDVAAFGGVEARRAAFDLNGPIGRWILQNDAVVQLGEVVFAHGGVSERWAPHGAKALALMARRALAGGDRAVLGDDGPLWYRGYLLAEEPLACAELDRALAALGAERMVVGHTTQKTGRVAARCGGRLLGIDTGISDPYGGNLAALAIEEGDARALYAQSSEDLPDP